MAYEDYIKAQQSAKTAYRKKTSKGLYPYLPVLDDILSLEDVECEIHLGVQDIPLNQVVGTCTAGRTNAFASNFMPLLSPSSEFAAKWSNLQDAQEEEGIHDAIKAYEYMGKYYVLEGNKRVSVLKYYDSPSIVADVTRKVPIKTNEPDVLLYYEYMTFYESTKINYVQFTKPGSYSALITAVGKDLDYEWTDDDRLDFSYFHAVFRKAYNAQGGEKLSNINNNDAMLFYLSLYEYDEIKNSTQADIEEHLKTLWPELILLNEKETVEFVMDPTASRNVVKSVLKKIIPTKKKIAFVYDKKPENSNWVYNHELGRLHLDEALGKAVETKSFVTLDVDEEAEELLEMLCEDKYDIIFTTTPNLIKPSIKVASIHPNVKILNCSPYSPHNTVRTYYPRMYEGKFLTGMIAGSLCENNKIGYMADYPIYGSIANINAFALGAQMTNPRAKVYLSWTTTKNDDADKLFWDEHVNYISSLDMIIPEDTGKSFGLYSIHDDDKTNLAMSITNWGVFYEKLVNNIISGTLQTEGTEERSGESKAMNYWWGLSAGAIDVICSNHISSQTNKLVHLIKKSITSGVFHPFTGPLKDQNGKLRVSDTELLSPEDILTLDWLVENVIGEIPTLDDLQQQARPVVMLRGVDSVTNDQTGGTIL